MKNIIYKKTLIHEIGHYVAHELNKDLFNVGEGVNEIYLLSEQNIKAFGHLGGTKPNIPKDYIKSDEIINLPQFIAVQIYGCIFQTVYELFDKNRKSILSDCFTSIGDKNGKKDFEALYEIENKFPGAKRKKLVEFAKCEYIDMIGKDEHFQPLFNLQLDEIILKNDDNYIVDLEKLKIKLNHFMKEHSKHYKIFIYKINEIIEERKNATS